LVGKGNVPFYLKFWAKLTHLLENGDFNRYSLVAPEP